MSFPIHLRSQRYNYMFYFGYSSLRVPTRRVLVPLDQLHYLHLITGYFFPSLGTAVPRPRPSSLVPDPCPSSFDPFWHIYSRVRFGRSGLITYFTLVVPLFIYLSQYTQWVVKGTQHPAKWSFRSKFVKMN